MSLYKRGNVWWSYLYQDGVRHAVSTGTTNRKQAEKIEDKLKADLNDARFHIVEFDPDITFGAIAARFLASGSARSHHAYHLGFLSSFFSDLPALRITKGLAEEFRKKRRKVNPKIKEASGRLYLDPEGEKLANGLIKAPKLSSADCHKKYG